MIAIEKLKEMQTHHHESTTPMDDYHTGMYNGMEFMLCMIEEREANYKDVESPTQRRRELESLIKGHMEAMRPLLNEWSELK